MLIFGEEIFLDLIWKLLHHEGGWGKLPVVTSSPGVAVLGTKLESREFPQAEPPLLCKRRLPLCHPGTQSHCTWDECASTLCKRSTVCTPSACSVVPELTEVCTKNSHIKAQLKLIKIHSKALICPVTITCFKYSTNDCTHFPLHQVLLPYYGLRD